MRTDSTRRFQAERGVRKTAKNFTVFTATAACSIDVNVTASAEIKDSSSIPWN